MLKFGLTVFAMGIVASLLIRVFVFNADITAKKVGLV